jgi:hypothetical protein
MYLDPFLARRFTNFMTSILHQTEYHKIELTPKRPALPPNTKLLFWVASANGKPFEKGIGDQRLILHRR